MIYSLPPFTPAQAASQLLPASEAHKSHFALCHNVSLYLLNSPKYLLGLHMPPTPRSFSPSWVLPEGSYLYLHSHVSLSLPQTSGQPFDNRHSEATWAQSCDSRIPSHPSPHTGQALPALLCLFRPRGQNFKTEKTFLGVGYMSVMSKGLNSLGKTGLRSEEQVRIGSEDGGQGAVLPSPCPLPLEEDLA